MLNIPNWQFLMQANPAANPTVESMIVEALKTGS